MLVRNDSSTVDVEWSFDWSACDTLTFDQTDTRSHSTHELHLQHRLPIIANSAYHSCNTTSQFSPIVTEPALHTGAIHYDGSELLGLGQGAFALGSWATDEALDGACTPLPPWPSELMNATFPEDQEGQSSSRASTTCLVSESCTNHSELEWCHTGYVETPLDFDDRTGIGYCWDRAELQPSFSTYGQSTQDGHWCAELGTTSMMESSMNQDEISPQPTQLSNQLTVALERCDSGTGKSKTGGSTSPNARSVKRFLCDVRGCKSEGFAHSFDLQRHERSVHALQGAGYRCPVRGCPKADKLFQRRDGYKKHVMKQHSNENPSALVKKFNRSSLGSKTRPFSVTTLKTMSNEEDKRRSTPAFH